MREDIADIVAAAAAASAGTGTLLARGAADAGSAWAPFNTLAAVLLGEEAVREPGFQPRATSLGLAINIGGLALWGLLYRRLFARVSFPASLLTGALAGAALYLLDYHAAPPPFRPGFERYLTGKSIALKYAAVALALALVPAGEGR